MLSFSPCDHFRNSSYLRIQLELVLTPRGWILSERFWLSNFKVIFEVITNYPSAWHQKRLHIPTQRGRLPHSWWLLRRNRQFSLFRYCKLIDLLANWSKTFFQFSDFSKGTPTGYPTAYEASQSVMRIRRYSSKCACNRKLHWVIWVPWPVADQELVRLRSSGKIKWSPRYALSETVGAQEVVCNVMEFPRIDETTLGFVVPAVVDPPPATGWSDVSGCSRKPFSLTISIIWGATRPGRLRLVKITRSHSWSDPQLIEKIDNR